MRNPIPLLVLSILLLPLSVAGQAPTYDSAPGPRQSSSQKSLESVPRAAASAASSTGPLEQKALALLAEVIAEIRSLRLAENRIRLQLTVAELLWKRDEARARAILHQALGELDLLTGEADQSTQPDNPRSAELNAQLRRDALSAAARLDARLTRERIKSSPQLPAAATGHGEAQFQELSLALEMVAGDPQQAFEVAEQSLAQGLSDQFMELIARLQEKDHELAGRLANRVAEKLLTENLATRPEAAHSALRLMKLVVRPSSAATSSGGAAPAPLLDPRAVRSVMEHIVSNALAGPADPSVLLSLQSMMPEMDKHAPASASALRRKIAEYNRSPAQGTQGTQGTRIGDEYQPLLSSGSVDELLEAAPRAPETARAAFYQQAVWKASEQGDMKRAKEIIDGHVRDPERRDTMFAEVYARMLRGAEVKGEVGEIKQLLNRARSKEERIAVLTQLATAAAGAGESQTAEQALAEAVSLMSDRARNFQELNSQLQIVRASAVVNREQSFTLLEAIVDRLNELIGAAVVMAGFYPEELSVDDEVRAQALRPFLSGQRTEELAALARADFDRAKQVTDRLRHPVVGIMARLFLAQAALSVGTEVKRVTADGAGLKR